METGRDGLHDDGTRRQEHDGSRRERWADLSYWTTDTGSKSTVHQDLDNDAGEIELLDKVMRDTLRAPQRSFEILRAEPGQQGWASISQHGGAGWRSKPEELAAGTRRRRPRWRWTRLAQT